MPNPNKKIGPKANTPKPRMGKRGLMQTDPITGMPVAQPGSTPMFPVSQGVNGGSTARFNPMINQYAQANPLANAAYASQPMPALAQQMRLQKIERKLLPKQGAIGTPAPTEGVKTEVIKPTMQMEKVIKPLPPVQDTLNYRQMSMVRKALNQTKDDSSKDDQSNTLKEIGEKVGGYILDATSLPAAGLVAKAGIKASEYFFGSKDQAVDSAKNWAEGKAALKQKPIPEDATGLQNLAASGPKGKAAVEKMGYETNALARMKGNGMYKKNCGYKK